MPAQIVLKQLEAIRVLLSPFKTGLELRERKHALLGIVFFVVALVAAFFGFGGIAAASAGNR